MYIPDINPYLIHWGFLSVRWYGFFMAVSMAVGLLYLAYEANRHGIPEDFIYNAGGAAIVAGIVGARLVFVLTNIGYFSQHPGQIIRVDLGGLSIHGGIAGGILVGWWYARRAGLRLLPLLDWTVPGIGVGVVLVRIGNIFNQEILGFPAAVLGGSRHPAQLYGAAIGIVLLAIYAYQRNRDLPDGYRFWTAVIWYTVLRFFEEMFREQNTHYLISYVNSYWGIGFMTLTQWVTPIILIAAWYARRQTVKASLYTPLATGTNERQAS